MSPKNIRGKSKGGTVSQMIWGCFIGDKLSPIVFINGTVNTDIYIDLLANTFISFVDVLAADGITDIVFQQDNAPPHVAKRTTEFLENTMREHRFSVMEWPPNSPDMNPIEHLWAHLKLELHRRYPDTKYLRGSSDAVRLELCRRLMEVWWQIGEGVLQNLLESMPHRVHALIKAGGWYTEY